METTQEQLFNAWNEQCERLKNLSAFFQNNIEWLYTDGIITAKDVETSLEEFRNLYISSMVDIQDLYKKIELLHLNFIAEKTKETQ
jgi:hypothetical protein